jgi:phytoene/squalene synthetase
MNIMSAFDSRQSPAASITRKASKQSYYTVRFLVDRDRIQEAYQAYAYFRWVDDRLDQVGSTASERIAFIDRQQSLVLSCYRGNCPPQTTIEERMLVDLIRNDREKNSGLQAYIRNLMAVMAFDAHRRGRLISEIELAEYSRLLATAVTEALHYFIGHNCRPPRCEASYLAATGAHITHMLRDTTDDNQAGYYNIPREYLESHKITPQDVNSAAYRAWVQTRVKLAHDCLIAGKKYLAQVENIRCRVAGFAYIGRFESVLDAIERDDYQLRSEYPESKSLGSMIGLSWSAFSQALAHHPREATSSTLLARRNSSEGGS